MNKYVARRLKNCIERRLSATSLQRGHRKSRKSASVSQLSPQEKLRNYYTQRKNQREEWARMGRQMEELLPQFRRDLSRMRTKWGPVTVTRRPDVLSGTPARSGRGESFQEARRRASQVSVPSVGVAGMRAPLASGRSQNLSGRSPSYTKVQPSRAYASYRK